MQRAVEVPVIQQPRGQDIFPVVGGYLAAEATAVIDGESPHVPEIALEELLRRSARY